MGQALYRKYRSKSLSEIIGQEHITTALSNALKQGNISHAYLLTGPRGVGKTSIARILAHEINGLPYDETINHLDIIEIDAASNRRIDEIRELRERVHTAPAAAKYKVYIIDEVHMLTKEAFNALLKTLEEPPAHAIFILATTEAHKLPETIVSRTQRFTFKPIDTQKAVAHLRSIADLEDIKISDEALELIAEHGGGSFRDSISLLDQSSAAEGRIELEDVQAMLGIAPDEVIEQLLSVLEHGTPPQLAAQLQEMRGQGFNPARIAKQLSGLIRQHLLNNRLSFGAQETGSILHDLLYVSASHDPEASLEIALITIMLKYRGHHMNTPQIEASAPAHNPVAATKPRKAASIGKPQTEPITAEIHPEEPVPKPKPAPKNIDITPDVWQQTLEAIKTKHNTLYGVARMAKATVNEEGITLCFKFAFHQKRINESKNKQILADVIEEITGKPIKINCTVDKHMDAEPAPQAAAPKTKPADSASIDTISNIFGSAEVIE